MVNLYLMKRLMTHGLSHLSDTARQRSVGFCRQYGSQTCHKSSSVILQQSARPSEPDRLPVDGTSAAGAPIIASCNLAKTSMPILWLLSAPPHSNLISPPTVFFFIKTKERRK